MKRSFLDIAGSWQRFHKFGKIHLEMVRPTILGADLAGGRRVFDSSTGARGCGAADSG
ncbi:MAG: hypothetical protein H3C34_05765 [Caldilineaceae bacterium]|nr:hypothetical protein [Caldilineaceae bacterium]